MKPNLHRRRIWLFLWVAGILFPMAWLGNFSRGFRSAFDAVFGPLWVHIFMHALLFAGLAIFLLALLKPRPLLKSLGLVLGAVIVVSIFQEALQALGAGTFSLAGSAFDLGVDLAGGALGGLVSWWRQNPGRTGRPGITDWL